MVFLLFSGHETNYRSPEAVLWQTDFPDVGQFGEAAEESEHHFSERPGLERQEELQVGLGWLMALQIMA